MARITRSLLLLLPLLLVSSLALAQESKTVTAEGVAVVQAIIWTLPRLRGPGRPDARR